MDQDEAVRRFVGRPVAHLATVGTDGRPHVVPITFAVVDQKTDADTDTGNAVFAVVFAVDHKPKTTTHLKRLANIEAYPAVALLTDEYDDDWARLWWVRADATAAVLPQHDARVEPSLDALAGRYAPYRTHRPRGPVVWCQVDRWSGWSAG